MIVNEKNMQYMISYKQYHPICFSVSKNIQNNYGIIYMQELEINIWEVI